MKVTLELELDRTVQGVYTAFDPFGEGLEVRWKVLSHDFTVPEDMDDINTVVHLIQPIKLEKQPIVKSEWVTKC